MNNVCAKFTGKILRANDVLYCVAIIPQYLLKTGSNLQDRQNREKITTMRKNKIATGLGLISAVLLASISPFVMAHDVSEAARDRMQNGGILDYIWTGAEHMLTGYDHLLFLLGVMFFLNNFRDILKFVTAFTLGHTITLVFATFAGISADHYLIDAVIAVTVMYKGFENLDGFRRWIGTGAPPLLFMVFSFGLIHGFGLSARLQDLTMSGEQGLLGKILFFNLGVELGQIAALLVMGVVIRAWQKTIVWEPITRIVNGALVFFGFLLLLFQLHGYLHESGHVHGPAQSAPAGEMHSHNGGEPHVH